MFRIKSKFKESFVHQAPYETSITPLISGFANIYSDVLTMTIFVFVAAVIHGL